MHSRAQLTNATSARINVGIFGRKFVAALAMGAAFSGYRRSSPTMFSAMPTRTVFSGRAWLKMLPVHAAAMEARRTALAFFRFVARVIQRHTGRDCSNEMLISESVSSDVLFARPENPGVSVFVNVSSPPPATTRLNGDVLHEAINRGLDIVAIRASSARSGTCNDMLKACDELPSTGRAGLGIFGLSHVIPPISRWSGSHSVISTVAGRFYFSPFIGQVVSN
ncbi:MAG TPA: hypothetical protein VFO46_02470 [Candidatus Sulfotelmatobacter sp.]|nr:hypothetical protein [Candidatus Sulfotelmatobacter sp.]